MVGVGVGVLVGVSVGDGIIVGVEVIEGEGIFVGMGVGDTEIKAIVLRLFFESKNTTLKVITMRVKKIVMKRKSLIFMPSYITMKLSSLLDL